jgi:hypothetical protein
MFDIIDGELRHLPTGRVPSATGASATATAARTTTAISSAFAFAFTTLALRTTKAGTATAAAFTSLSLRATKAGAAGTSFAFAPWCSLVVILRIVAHGLVLSIDVAGAPALERNVVNVGGSGIVVATATGAAIKASVRSSGIASGLLATTIVALIAIAALAATCELKRGGIDVIGDALLAVIRHIFARFKSTLDEDRATFGKPSLLGEFVETVSHFAPGRDTIPNGWRLFVAILSATSRWIDSNAERYNHRPARRISRFRILP